MGKIDAVTNQYFRNNIVFADAANYVLHGGKPVIHPENLKELDTTVYLPPGDFGVKGLRRTSDVTKAYTAKEDSSGIYLIISMENQSLSSLVMPVRTLLEDAMQYMDQIRVKTAEYESLIQKKEFRWEDAEERLSGIRYSDRLKPVITIVVHWEGTRWKGPRSLHDMLDFEEEWVKKWVPDWPLYLLDAAEFGEMKRGCFQSDLGKVLYLVQSDKKTLSKIKEGRHEKIELTSEAKRVVKAITGLDIPEKGVSEVTSAVREYLEEVRQEGKAETQLENIRSLLEETGWSLEEVMCKLRLSEDEKEKYRTLYKQNLINVAEVNK